MARRQTEGRRFFMSNRTAQENQEATEAPLVENLTEDTEHLFRRLRGPLEGIRNHDRDALRDHLVLVHAPLVEYCARGFMASGEPVEDLVQEGYIGLVKAVDRYDPDKGIKFSTYACHLISGEIRHYLRDLGRLIHEPGWHSELRQRIVRTTEKLTTEFDRAPSPEEIAETLDIKVDSVREVLKNAQILNVDSLEDKRREDEDASDWSEQISDEDTSHEEIVDHQMVLGAALPQLKDLEKRAVTMFFFGEMSKTEIAREMGISINYAAYLVKRGLENLRQIIELSEASPLPGNSVAAPWAQQRARAAYLLELVKTKTAPSQTGETQTAQERRRAGKAVAPVPAVARKRVLSLVEFAGLLDEEVLRAARYDHEFGLLWLQISNWHEATENIGEADATRAATAVQKLARRSCRGVDKLAVAPPNAMPGLNLFLLLPHSGVSGEKVGERWREICNPETVHPKDPTQLGILELKSAFALFPRDGKSADQLFAFLGKLMR
jgi:RNA polymerase sigma-B factor